MYGHIERDLALMGLCRADAATPYEYATSRAPEVACFADNDARANFAFVAHVFGKAQYGREPLTEGELVAFDAFWRSFHANCRAYLGRGRYVRLFFKL